jgi:hypothetical protein
MWLVLQLLLHIERSVLVLARFLRLKQQRDQRKFELCRSCRSVRSRSSAVWLQPMPEKRVMCKNIVKLLLSALFAVACLQEASAQQIDAMPNGIDIRIVAESVPKFDIGGGCRINNVPSKLDAGMDEPTKRCMQDEQKARDQLKSRWPQLAAHDRIVCIGETYDASGMPPSYVVLSTCLLRAGLAKNSTD